MSPACVLVPGSSAFFTPHALCRLPGTPPPWLTCVHRAEPSPQHGVPPARSAVSWGLLGVHTALRLAWERRGPARGRRPRTRASDLRRQRAGLRFGTKPAPGWSSAPQGAAQVGTMTLSRHASSSHSNFGAEGQRRRFILVGLDQQPLPPPGRPPGAEAARPARPARRFSPSGLATGIPATLLRPSVSLWAPSGGSEGLP